MTQTRRFNPSQFDYSGILEIENALWPDCPTTLSELKHSDKYRDPKYFFQRLVLERKKTIVAYCEYGERYWSHVPGLFFLHISVHPDFQRQGYGTTLHNKILNHLSKFHPEKLYSWTREDKPSGYDFLKKYGYKWLCSNY